MYDRKDNGEQKGNTQLENLIKNLNKKIDQKIINRLNNIRFYQKDRDGKYTIYNEYKDKDDISNELLAYHDEINNDTAAKIKNSIKSINKSIKTFNNKVDQIFINNDKYSKRDKIDKTKINNDNYFDKIKDFIKSFKQIQNNLIENVFKIDKETIKKNLQNILNKLGICDEYRDTDEDSKKILVPLENDVKFTNSFKSLADNLTAQSEDFQNIYKSNINKFNNIILQNIDILHPHL